VSNWDTAEIMFRLFVAIDLPQEIKNRIEPICCGVPGARWLEPDQWHLTLRFVGEVDGGLFRDILDTLGEVKAEPFALTLKGLGFFPLRGTPETIWVGVEKSDGLVLLRGRVEGALAKAGLARDSRKFSPHVAIARLRQPHVPRLAGYLSANGLFESPNFRVDRFGLYSSVLSSSGAQYELEAEYPLNGKRSRME